ncbi:DUF3140 domain-containing protein [Micromonospora sp. HM5-17]|jgi:hypothetical protein|uniref:DUF3140 domain-containing protein n=1 Tax=Micromonospora sp. HM5-17 TaxID=2487710 RepID=UPI000F46C103|nr:DUF3140 domain-containing protein [Micromonospora sp. HM5-17]ROT31103.1 DUF3140 domain-containing protein [Micromonospora sp. HM5-17]
MSSRDDGRDIVREFRDAVNMNPGELDRWLATDASKAVGWRHDGGESVGHESGRRIIELLRKRTNQFTERDLAHMRKVVGYVRRHMAQRPAGDVRNTRWRYSLMNWGHDPLKEPLPPPGGPSRKALQRHRAAERSARQTRRG